MCAQPAVCVPGAAPAPSRVLILTLAFVVAVALPAVAQQESLDCQAARSRPLLPEDPERCRALGETIRRPGDLPLREYQEALGEYLRGFCHRSEENGWKRDEGVRDTGPFTAALQDGEWVGTYHGTHAPVVIWYSPEMIAWLKANRPVDGSPPPAEPAPVPDGAVMVKEMYPAPAAACAGVEPVTRLLPTSGAAVMVRAREVAHDGWYWGWFGWSGWDPDYPAGPSNRLPYQGFGQYCMNCHASAEDNLTFASLENVEGEPGEPLAFLSQHFFDVDPEPSHHRLVTVAEDDADRLGRPRVTDDPELLRSVPATDLPRPGWADVSKIPSETYDNVFVQAGGPTAASEFVTSDQCIGCHDAGGTGIQLDMTAPNPGPPAFPGASSGEAELLNLSPYATWRSSPMGLGGRDPIFYAQLRSETDTFHPEIAAELQTICLGCHGVTGQRQFRIDAHAAGDGCPDFSLEATDAVPFPPDPEDNPLVGLAPYGALARDGISCTACHRMDVGEAGGSALDAPENACIRERQELLNPQNDGFARTFTGSFVVGPPDELYGPFEDPKTKPMENALGITPKQTTAIQASEVCGSCHTVHLPVVAKGETVGYTYEQTTYPEWAFSDYRTGSTPQGELPYGAGPKAESCQGCHMPDADGDGRPYRSKIAGIQERSNFPETEHVLGAGEIDLEVRDHFSRHTLVGLNVFLVEMAQQFPDVLGIRTQDPMLGSKGLDPLLLTEQAMLDQAQDDTAEVSVGDVRAAGGTLRVPVSVTSHVGHKLPSGVGFRRVFLELSVLDAAGEVLWASGRTNRAGVIVDGAGAPVAGELWWKDDCSGLRHPDRLVYQPHYQTISRQDQVQIYQELVTAPAEGKDPECGLGAEPEGPLTTSFLSICGHVKDNRILPSGFLPLEERVAIARALGAGTRCSARSSSGSCPSPECAPEECETPGIGLARDAGPEPGLAEEDADYRTGGGDSLTYEIPLAELPREPAAVRATLYFQATPPFYLQDRFCTSKSPETQRLAFLAGHLEVDGTPAEDWKLEIVSTGEVPVE